MRWLGVCVCMWMRLWQYARNVLLSQSDVVCQCKITYILYLIYSSIKQRLISLCTGWRSIGCMRWLWLYGQHRVEWMKVIFGSPEPNRTSHFGWILKHFLCSALRNFVCDNYGIFLKWWCNWQTVQIESIDPRRMLYRWCRWQQSQALHLLNETFRNFNFLWPNQTRCTLLHSIESILEIWCSAFFHSCGYEMVSNVHMWWCRKPNIFRGCDYEIQFIYKRPWAFWILNIKRRKNLWSLAQLSSE